MRINSYAFFCLLMLLSAATSAQNWVDIGIKGGYGLNLLYNQNAFDDKNVIPKISTGYNYGGKIGFNLGENNEITFEVLSGRFNQNYDMRRMQPDSTFITYGYNLSYQTLDFLPMYRNNKDASYFEIGPQYTMVKSPVSGNSLTNGSTDISNYVVKNYYSAVVGFGAYMAGTENFGITFGLRLAYSLNDLMNSAGKGMNFPYGTNYATYKTSNPFSAMFVMEFNYDLGYLAKAKCGKRTKILLF
jgi:hypothetical protein